MDLTKDDKEGEERREINCTPPTIMSPSPPTHTCAHTRKYLYYTGSQVSAKVEYGQTTKAKRVNYVLGVSYTLHSFRPQVRNSVF